MLEIPASAERQPNPPEMPIYTDQISALGIDADGQTDDANTLFTAWI